MSTVGFLSPPYLDPIDGAVHWGGGERYALNLARAVHRASHGAVQVDIITFGPAAQTQTLEPGVTVRVLPATRNPQAPLALHQLSGALPAVVRSMDLIHAHQFLTTGGEVAIMLAKLYGKPVAATDLGGATSRVGESLGLNRFVDRYVCISDFAASFLGADDPVSVVKGGVDTSYHMPPPRPVQRDGFLFVGRLLPHKGIDRLIAALPSDLPLTVCGRPYHAAYFRRLLQLAEGKRVRFVHDAGDDMVRDLYRRSWATVVSSVWRDCYGISHGSPELMGLTMLESMACGTPAVVSNVASMPEFVEDGVTGFVYSTQEELTAALRRLAGEPGLSDAMGQRARAAVEAEWSFERAGARCLEVYAQIGLRVPAGVA